MARLDAIVSYLNDYLRIAEIGDSENALNGLQIENNGRVTKIGAAVDASTRTLREAGKRKINFLIVHHGLFWSGLQPVTRAFHGQIKLAFQKNIALYGAHIPLDLHPVVGNNALLARALGLRATTPFLEYKGQPIGVKSSDSLAREELVRRLEKALAGPVKAFLCGPKKTGTIGVVTGAAGSEIHTIAREGIDTYITGEAPHWAAVAAEELGINLLLGGHYATETFGVKALAAQVARRFKVRWEFIDCPTGL